MSNITGIANISETSWTLLFAVVPQPMPSSGWEEDDELRTPTVEEQNFPDSKVPVRSSSILVACVVEIWVSGRGYDNSRVQNFDITN